MKTALVVNPHARAFRQREKLISAVRLCARGGARFWVTSDDRALATAAREIIEWGADRVVLCGGDGTLMAGVSALRGVDEGAKLPEIVVAPAGTVATVARNWGQRADVLDTVVRATAGERPRVRLVSPTLQVLADGEHGPLGYDEGRGAHGGAALGHDEGRGAHGGAALGHERRGAHGGTALGYDEGRGAHGGAALVDDEGRGAHGGAALGHERHGARGGGSEVRAAREDDEGHVRTRIGFILGTGLVARFFEKYYARGGGGYARAASIVARTFTGSFLGDAYSRSVLDPLPCRLTVDGSELAPTAFSLVVTSVVRNLGLGMRVTHRAAEDPERPHLVASPLSARKLGPQAPRVMLARALKGADNFDGLYTELRIEFPEARGPWVLDGDVFFSNTVQVSAGPRVRVAAY